jgi:hypothetical protein
LILSTSPALLTLSLVAVSFKAGAGAGVWAVIRTAIAGTPTNPNRLAANRIFIAFVPIALMIVIVGMFSFTLMLLVLHLFGFLLDKGPLPVGRALTGRPKHGNHLFEVFPFRMTFRTCCRFDGRWQNEMLEGLTAFSTLVFKDWYRF